MTAGSRPSLETLKALSLALVLLTSTLAAQKVSIVVVDFEGYGIAEQDVIALTSRLRSELLRSGSFQVIERRRMQNILAKQDLQLSACTSDDCLVKIGRLLGARQAVSGSIGKVADVFSISARIIDVRTGERLIAVEFDVTGQLSDALREGMPALGRFLAETPQSAVSSPTAARPLPTTPATPRLTARPPAQTTRSPARTSTTRGQPESPETTNVSLMPRSFVGLDLNMIFALNVKSVPNMGPRVMGVSLFGVAFKQYAQPLIAGQPNLYFGYGTDYFIFPYGSIGVDYFLNNGWAYLGVAVTSRFALQFFPFPMVAAGLIL